MLFVPQPGPPLFVIGVREDEAIAPALRALGPIEPFNTLSLRAATVSAPRTPMSFNLLRSTYLRQ